MLRWSTQTSLGPPGATGVNDFRYANQWGYTPGEAVERKGDLGLTAPQHTFLDYENALAVDRANKAALGGKTDWTGEHSRPCRGCGRRLKR